MKLILALFLLLFFFVNQARAFTHLPELPDDLKAWRVGITMSSFYPVEINRIYGVNESEDWTSLLHNHSSRRSLAASRFSNVRVDFPEYDGFELYLGPPVSYIRQIAETSHLPDTVYLYWTSLFNQRFFVTQFHLSEQLKAKMMIQKQFFYDNRMSCYENDLVFGLLPNGQAKVWLSGCATYTFIDEIAPVKERNKSIDGRDAESYRKGWEYQDILERAKSENATIDPIPWERVNQVVTYLRPDFRAKTFSH